LLAEIEFIRYLIGEVSVLKVCARLQRYDQQSTDKAASIQTAIARGTITVHTPKPIFVNRK
jgi:hypothetical protein